MRKIVAILATATSLVIAGCGGSSHTQQTTSTTTKTPQHRVSCPPPPGEGFLGSCVPKPVQAFGNGTTVPLQAAVAGPKFPDVSSWQGAVNWSPVKNWQVANHWTPGAVFKMGEFTVDPFAFHNAQQLHALHMVAQGYWFVRNTGCAHESQQIINEAKFLGVKVVWLDLEVPEARGYGACLLGPVKAAGFTVGAYTSPGSYPGGASGVPYAWMAAYGPAHPPVSPFGGAIKAFQCTDGIFGCVTSVPGLGKVDVSVDFGALGLGQQAPVPAPKPVSSLYDQTVRHFGNVAASEFNTVRTWNKKKCRNPVHRPVCVSSRAHLLLLTNRLHQIDHLQLFHRQQRRMGMQQLLNQR